MNAEECAEQVVKGWSPFYLEGLSSSERADLIALHTKLIQQCVNDQTAELQEEVNDGFCSSWRGQGGCGEADESIATARERDRLQVIVDKLVETYKEYCKAKEYRKAVARWATADANSAKRRIVMIAREAAEAAKEKGNAEI